MKRSLGVFRTLVSGYVASGEKEGGTVSQAELDVSGHCNATQDTGDVSACCHKTQDVQDIGDANLTSRPS